MNSSDGLVADVPAGVVTVTSIVSVPAGDTASIVESDIGVNDAAVPPKSTFVAPVNPLPVIWTVVASPQPARMSGRSW